MKPHIPRPPRLPALHDEEHERSAAPQEPSAAPPSLFEIGKLARDLAALAKRTELAESKLAVLQVQVGEVKREGAETRVDLAEAVEDIFTLKQRMRDLRAEHRDSQQDLTAEAQRALGTTKASPEQEQAAVQREQEEQRDAKSPKGAESTVPPALRALWKRNQKVAAFVGLVVSVGLTVWQIIQAAGKASP